MYYLFEPNEIQQRIVQQLGITSLQDPRYPNTEGHFLTPGAAQLIAKWKPLYNPDYQDTPLCIGEMVVKRALAPEFLEDCRRLRVGILYADLWVTAKDGLYQYTDWTFHLGNQAPGWPDWINYAIERCYACMEHYKEFDASMYDPTLEGKDYDLLNFYVDKFGKYPDEPGPREPDMEPIPTKPFTIDGPYY